MRKEIEFSPEATETLKNSRSILAFSGGVDSTALFHILVEKGIEFDMAMVDYGLRPESIDEVNLGRELAEKYGNKRFYLLQNHDKGFSEARGREIRYHFFEKLIRKHDYRNIITAHQLNDRLEWFFMQFGKGAGAIELLGFREIEERDSYRVIRPLLNYSKEELQLYLDRREERYFIDSSNLTYIYHRNRIRHRYTNRFLREFQSGVLKSFEYLDRDREELLEIVDISKICQLHSFKSSSQRSDLYHIDQILKSEGYMLSAKQRDEIVKQQCSVVGGEWVITLGNRVYIAPFRKTKMDKQFKERCRTLKIPSLIRPYLYETDPELETIKKIMREDTNPL